MAEGKPSKKGSKEAAKPTTAPHNSSTGFTAEERAAMKERARELKAAANEAEAEKDVLAAIAKMPASDRAMAKRLHAIIKDSAPGLSEDLVRDACVCQGRQGRLLLPRR